MSLAIPQNRVANPHNHVASPPSPGSSDGRRPAARPPAARRRDLLLLGDSKLISYVNVAAMNAAEVRFIAALGAARVEEGLFAGLDVPSAAPVEYVAQRDMRKPPEQRGSYRVLEDTQDLKGQRAKDPVQHCRRILVHSTANAQAQQKARARKLDQAPDELDKLARLACTRYYPDHDAVAGKVATIAAKRRIQAYPHTTITVTEDGTPKLDWHYDQNAIDAEAVR